MDKKQNFETNLKQLEEIVRALEGSDISLEEMLSLFEKGIHLTKECTTALDEAEQKISILMKNRETGEMVEEPFGGLGE
ncbi:MAG: exodeoxyribonuclease VII small subunit [Clostridia bacterium]|nr:exodeoxyribonuclease VII small subunit [Clostridia bacterium]